ncbi:MAG: VWA domain-containing protein [Dehalococcoidia bacterium]|nr:VWA domain-containing protein [Dehalococcoidia bacterium]
MKRILHPVRREDGQIFVLVALWMVALFGLVGLAVDVGLMFVARAELRRDVDAAALAAIVEMPNTTNVTNRANEYLTANDPAATLVSVQPNVPAAGQVTLNVSKNVRLVFLPLVPGVAAQLISGTDVQVTGFAVAGAGSAIDLAMSVDDTGSMNDGCNGSQSDTDGSCPIKEARDGANVLLNVMGVGDGTGVAAASLVPSRGCYNTSGSSGCVDYSGSGNKVVDLTTTLATLQTGIAAMVAGGGSGTNICTGTHYAGDRVKNSPAARTNARKVVVIMSDFDNNDSSSTAPFPSGSTCTQSGSTTNAHINTRDDKTLAAADAWKAQSVEIFVIGYSVEGTNDANTCSSSWRTTIDTDTARSRTSGTDVWDRRLAKCVASSTAGTNDHYFEAPTSADLNAAFTQIGRIISTRLLK